MAGPEGLTGPEGLPGPNKLLDPDHLLVVAATRARHCSLTGPLPLAVLWGCVPGRPVLPTRLLPGRADGHREGAAGSCRCGEFHPHRHN